MPGVNSKKYQRTQRTYARMTGTPCRARGSHQDALALVEYLMDNGGRSNLTQSQLAEVLGWQQRIGNTRVLDMARFQRARNHVKDGRDKHDRPCTGYSLHYRPSSRDNVWMLVDPSGSAGHHFEVARRELRGDLQQELAARTVIGRRIETAHSMADMCLKASPPDGRGHHLMTAYAVELERFGAVSNTTLAELMMWTEHQAAAAPNVS